MAEPTTQACTRCKCETCSRPPGTVVNIAPTPITPWDTALLAKMAAATLKRWGSA